jgi:hypothetical protein
VLNLKKKSGKYQLEDFEILAGEIFSVKTKDEFETLAFKIFLLQYHTNQIYREYVDLLQIKPFEVHEIEAIPFLPVGFFKDQQIISGKFNYQTVFLSSATTGSIQSKHYVVDPDLYMISFTKTFRLFYGNPADYCILALLPGYMERKGSSLIFMVNELMKQSGHSENGFFLYNFEELFQRILELKKAKQKYILIGVSYALLDFAMKFPINLSDGIIIETGGMKGKRKELVKQELHEILKSSFEVKEVNAEYGMTELLSQAYSKGGGIYTAPPWMKVLIRDVYDPFLYIEKGHSGGINIIDLANLYSCSFIETSDLGKINQKGEFEILGRFDNSDIRGCNLLVS